MPETPFGKPTQLGHVLQNLVRRKGLAEQSATHELQQVWHSVAGERIASMSHVKRLRNGILEIGVSNGAILEELSSYLRGDLLAAIQKQEPGASVASLKFVRAR